ncbi:MAG: response regulator [Fimbriiglobus sp.]|nr:response regulator [Fimbriiglobus sp.]
MGRSHGRRGAAAGTIPPGGYGAQGDHLDNVETDGGGRAYPDGIPRPHWAVAVLPPLPPNATFRDRLLRPHRWRLWVQFALLGMFVVLGPLLFTSQRLLDSGREVLVDHETIDLSDEANLRVNEFREDMAYFARDVRKRVNDQPAVRSLAQVVTGVADGLNLPADRVWDDPDTPLEARRKYLHGTAVGVYAFRFNGVEAVVEASSAPLPSDPGRRAALVASLTDVGRRLGREFNRSGLHFQPPAGNEPGRAILATSERRGDHIVAVVLDFTRYVNNRQRISPRHYYIVTDPAGRVLVHPTKAADPARTLPEVVQWKYPSFEGRGWFDTTLEPEAKWRRMAQAVQSGGARLTAVPAAELACLYRKGYFSRTLREALGEEKAAAAALRLNQRMWEAMAADPKLRVGEASPAFGYVEVSHPTPDGLKAACEVVGAWWRAETGDPRAAVRWSTPLECQTYQGQLTPLRVDLNDVDDPGWLAVAASTEELRQDIDERFHDVFLRWVVPGLLVSGVLGIALVMTLTYSVNRLARAASRLDTDDPNPKPLPLGGPYEVGELARTLQSLVGHVQDRDRQLRDRAARYETILRAAGEGVLVTSSGGVIEEANKAAGRMFGTTPEGLIGRAVTSLLRNPNDLPAAQESDTVAGAASGSRTLEAVQGMRPDGSDFWLEMNLKPVPLRDRVVMVCVLRDITQRREAEDRIRKLNEDLDTRVKQRTAELEEANAKLEVALRQAEAAVRAKDTFVATMSHELRQPLHIIIGFTEALKEEAADLGAEAIEPDLNKILSAAKHLLDLINDILDMAKISAGKMELSIGTIPLVELVGDVKTLVGPLAAKNANEFVVDAPPDLGQMTADGRRVRQMLLNLLSNAFKFTQAGRVDLRVRRFTESGRDWVRFTVSDTGRGMTPEQVGRLFQRFYQADSGTTRGAGGTGLGLAITQSFNDLMGGQPIRVTSQEGVGTEFVVTLPAVVEAVAQTRPPSPPPAALPAADTPPPQPADGRTVLVVDDDPMVRELMQRFLGKEGFRVLLAGTGDDGLKLARDERPCLITLDVTMPGADGWTVLGQLKGDPATADIPVVMLTIVDDRGRGFALGATEYLTKPIDWQRLGAILRRYLVGRSDGVLVIDDDPQNREIIRRHLEKEGWAIREATNGEQGLAAFDEHKPGLVLLDLMMPVLDGFGFLDELNRRYPGHRVPVVVLTAKELTSADFDRLNGRVARILEKGDLNHLDALLELIRRTAKR